MDSLYHSHQYLHAFHLICFSILCIFCCFSLFLLGKKWPKKIVKVSDSILFPMKFSSHRFKFATWIHCIIQYIMCVISSWYICLFAFLVFLQCFYFRKIWLGKSVKVSDQIMFPMKFSSDSLHICYIDSLYHNHQYVGVYKLTYFMIFFIFCVLSLFLLRKKCGVGKVLRFLIKSCFLSSSHQNHIKFA